MLLLYGQGSKLQSVLISLGLLQVGEDVLKQHSYKIVKLHFLSSGNS